MEFHGISSIYNFFMKRFSKKSQNAEKRPARAEWDSISSWYDKLVGEDGSEFHREIVIPGAIQLLNPLKSEHILDVGCGQGVFCRILSKKGIQSTGVDISENLILEAKKKSGYRADLEDYRTGNAADMNFLKSASFDAAVSILALQDMEDLNSTAGEISRCLKSGGRLVWVIMHPCFRIPRQSHWGYDEAKKLQFRRIDRYLSPLSIPIQTRPGANPDITTSSRHRPLSGYVNALAENGLCIQKMEEWASHKKSDPGPRAKAENRARSEFPLFLAILAKKS